MYYLRVIITVTSWRYHFTKSLKHLLCKKEKKHRCLVRDYWQFNEVRSVFKNNCNYLNAKYLPNEMHRIAEFVSLCMRRSKSKKKLHSFVRERNTDNSCIKKKSSYNARVITLRWRYIGVLFDGYKKGETAVDIVNCGAELSLSSLFCTLRHTRTRHGNG